MSQFVIVEPSLTHPTSVPLPASWTDVNKKVLIDVLSSFSEGRFANLSNKKEKWIAILETFNHRTGKFCIIVVVLLSEFLKVDWSNIIGLNYTKKMLTTQCTALKKQLSIYHHYAHQSGFGMDARGVVISSPSVLNAYYAAHAGSLQYANAPLTFYDDLLSLFGRKYYGIVLKVRLIANDIFKHFRDKVTLQLAPTRNHPLEQSERFRMRERWILWPPSLQSLGLPLQYLV